MKKILFFSIAMVVLITASYSQSHTYGTNPDPKNNNSVVLANGLSQIYSATGKYTISADGAGSLFSSYPIRVDKPNSGSTVAKAIIMGASTGFSFYSIPNGCITVNGTPVNWDFSTTSGISSYNHYADVTSLVAGIIDPAPAGINTLTVGECSSSNIDGTALLVVFADPLTYEKTIVIMFGALSTTGDNFSLTLGQPIDPNDPSSVLDMGLGISFSAYGPSSGQISIIDVNGQRLTSSANGYDDGVLGNGALITVGGIGDLNTNPPDPYSSSSSDIRYDDELYSLLPFIDNTTTNILISTINPSNDDNIFLSYFQISGAAIIGEGILLTQTTVQENVGSSHTVKAHIQDNNGNPVAGKTVSFSVLSGPNSGVAGTGTTNAAGDAFFSYTGIGGPGVDEIQACFQNSQGETQCSNIITIEWILGGPPVPLSDWALYVGIALMLTFVVIRFRRIF